MPFGCFTLGFPASRYLISLDMYTLEKVVRERYSQLAAWGMTDGASRTGCVPTKQKWSMPGRSDAQLLYLCSLSANTYTHSERCSTTISDTILLGYLMVVWCLCCINNYYIKICISVRQSWWINLAYSWAYCNGRSTSHFNSHFPDDEEVNDS